MRYIKSWSIKCIGSTYVFLILSVHFTSAGLLKSIREAAEPKDMDFKLPIEETVTEQTNLKNADIMPSETSLQTSKIQSKMDHVVTPSEESNLLQTLQTSLTKLSTVIQDRADVASGNGLKKTCQPGDVLCQAGLSMGNTGTHMQKELSTAVIKSFGTMMSEMVNTTISRGLVEFMAQHGSSHGETAQEEHKAMVQMAANVLQTVSSRVIKSFTFFLQMAISGAMWDLFNQMKNGVTTAYDHHQKSMNELRGTAALNSPPERIPKPSLPDPAQQVFDPVKTLLNAGALTSLSFPNSGFDLMSSLKSNLFTGETNDLEKKSGTAKSNYIPAPVLTPFGVFKNN